MYLLVLLLALPALATIEIELAGETRVLTAVHDGDVATTMVGGAAGRWRTATAGGEAGPALLADRPAEERARPAWSVRWAVPVTPGAGGDAPAGRLPEGVSAVVHAPTPTGEPLGLPALLLASFPLSPDRRHAAPGPLTDFLLEQAAGVYARLLPGLAPGPGLLELVPGPLAAGELDAKRPAFAVELFVYEDGVINHEADAARDFSGLQFAIHLIMHGQRGM